MDYLAGGQFRATLHRVLNKTGSARFSIPFFYEPNMEAVLEPLIADSDPRKREMMDYIKKTFGLEKITPADLFFERLQNINKKTFDP
jgi:isopenicillin N synthase-like dioxygenase